MPNFDKQTEDTLKELTAELHYLAEHNPVMLARAGGAIQKEFSMLRRSEEANRTQPQILGATPGHGPIEAMCMRADINRAADAHTGLEALRSECAAIVAQIPPTQLVALRALVGPDDVLVAQRFCALSGRPIPGLVSGARR